MRDLPHLAARLFDTPLLAHPGKARQVAQVLMQNMGKKMWWDDDEEVNYSTGSMQVTADKARPIYSVQDGVAFIPVTGSLVHKSGNLHPSSGLTGYDGLTTKLRMARADASVRAIWLDIDSPGGEVAGCFSLADEIHAGSARFGGKPVWAMANEMAYSAAYAIASQADVLVAPRTGEVGSIGVVMMHADYSGALDEAGIKVTMIHAGAHKVDGNPYEALPESVRTRWEAECEDTRQLFASSVARGRGIGVDAVLATEAQCYGAPDALRLGLIDAVATEPAAFAALISELRAAA